MADESKNIVEFTLVYNRLKVKLYNYVWKMVNNKSICDDVVQNVFMKFFENISSIRNKDSASFWIFKTARNEIYTYYRNKKIHVDQFNVSDSDEIELDSGEDVEAEIERREISGMIFGELDKMAVEQRDVFLLKEYGGLSYKEIAAVMNIDEELVKSRLYKTRQKLIKNLGRLIPD